MSGAFCWEKGFESHCVRPENGIQYSQIGDFT